MKHKLDKDEIARAVVTYVLMKTIPGLTIESPIEDIMANMPDDSSYNVTFFNGGFDITAEVELDV